MKTIISIDQVRIIWEYLKINFGEKEYRFRIRDLSRRLAVASEEDIRDDEDLSLAALLEDNSA